MFNTLEADIIIMQEAKIQRKDLKDDMVLIPGWDVYFSLPQYKKGYSGIAIYTRTSKCCPIRAEEGLTGLLCPPNSPSTRYRDLSVDRQIGGYPDLDDLLPDGITSELLDSEGRAVVLEFPAFVLIGVYMPATRDETRTDFRHAFIDLVDARVRNLVAIGKEVVLAGDLNVVRGEHDSCGLRDQLQKEGLTAYDFLSSRACRFMNQIVFGGRVVGGERDRGREKSVLWDVCREFHPQRRGMYTCWDVRKNNRPVNAGSRIDYILCTSRIKDWVIDANIQPDIYGSDHCPVFITLGDRVKPTSTSTSTTTGNEVEEGVHVVDVMNPEGMFKDGKRLREWTIKEAPVLSARLLPEFSGRQSIREMFSRKRAPEKRPQYGESLPPTLDFLADPPPSQPPPRGKKQSSSSKPPPVASRPTKKPKMTASSNSKPVTSTRTTTQTPTMTTGGGGRLQRSVTDFFAPKAP